MKTVDVVSICNALVDILVSVQDSDIERLNLTKGIMHLVDDEKQKALIDDFHTQAATTELGGSSLNAIRTLAAIGCKTAFAGMIGQDSFGRTISTRMDELGIAAKLQETQGAATGSCFILVTPDGERTMNTNLGASVMFDESLVPFDTIEQSRIFHFCGYQWGSARQINAIHKAIEHAKLHKTLVSFDVADPFVVEASRSDFIDVIDTSADIVFANQREAELLYQASPEEACNKICDSGAIAVIKLGKDGALIGKGNQRYHIAPKPTTVVDTTAAGDMFAAGFLYGQSVGLGLKESGDVAAHLASDVIIRLGAKVSSEAIAAVKNGLI